MFFLKFFQQLFQGKASQQSAASSAAQPKIATKPASRQADNYISMDDSDLRQNVSFDSSPLTMEQMRDLDHAI